jgi:two-component system LytT family response regulator
MNQDIKIKALIIEDEEPARTLIKHYLIAHEDITMVGECADGYSGLKLIKELNPDLVFLDIQMPRLTGFELLEVLEQKPEIIFTTAYDDYAIQAFDLNAVDYLLKPYSQERFDTAVEKAIKRIRKGNVSKSDLSKLTAERPGGSPALNRIVVRKGSSISFIPVGTIHYIEAEDDYVMIWHSEGKALKQQTMKYYEKNLPENDFARIHRSYIVFIEQIERIEPYGKDTHKAILKNGKSLPVSRNGYKALKDKVKF